MKNVHKNKGLRSQVAKAVVAAGMAGAVAVGGTLAYFTDTDTAVNRFSVAPNLQIKVVEDNWNGTDSNGDDVPDASSNIVPGQTIPKDPKIQNTQGTDAWIFAQVSIPVANVKIYDTNTKKISQNETELFTYAVNGSQGWSEVGTASRLNGKNVHTYAYKDTVAPNGETAPIFNSVTLKNIVESSFTGPLDIKVVGYGIQKEGFADSASAWTAYKGQTEAAGSGQPEGTA